MEQEKRRRNGRKPAQPMEGAPWGEFSPGEELLSGGKVSPDGELLSGGEVSPDGAPSPGGVPSSGGAPSPGGVPSPQALESAQLLEELRGLRAREREWVFREDLEKIRRAFPRQAPDSIPALGDDFLKMRSLGIDPVTAFAALLQARQAARPETPPPMGPADGQSDPEQDFFGPEEVRRMTPRQVEANLKKIERSQRRW